MARSKWGLFKWMERSVLQIGKARAQGFYEWMYRTALTGMNVGPGASVTDSGEIGAMRYVRSRLQQATAAPPWVVFDCGANVGNYALALLESFPPACEIHAFEPASSAYRTLTECIGDGRPNVHLHHFGFSSQSGRPLLYLEGPASALASLSPEKVGSGEAAMMQTEEVQLTTLDEFCAEHGLRRIHFLKLDVEGHELEVLEGARRMLENRAIDFLQFEFGNSNIDSRTYFRDFFRLLRKDYSISRILQDGLRRIDRYSEWHEIFRTTNFLAELKSSVTRPGPTGGSPA